jgi:prepilin-type N-terminal cleavage/methylation domain-containing protein
MQRHFARRRLAGFTLVELLVVIAILGILTALITVAAQRAMVAAKRTRVKAEVDQLAAAFKAYKAKYGSYPPNFNNGNNTAAVKRHLLKAFPRISTNELNAIAGLDLTAAEAAWFWLAGFSANPTQPVFATDASGNWLFGTGTNTPLFEFDKTRLMPSRSPKVNGKPFPIYAYKPQGTDLTEPYVYFDVSRTSPTATSPVPPFHTAANGDKVWPYISSKTSQFVESNSFQVLAAGLDNAWSSDSSRSVATDQPTFPEGPFIGADADNLASFSTKSMEDSMP